MQQYRINYVLLIGLMVGTLLTSGAVYGLWRFQIVRKSDTLIADAEKALEKKDYRTAAMFYSQYLAIRPADNDTRIKHANTYLEITELDDVKIEEIGAALRSVEGTVRRIPEAKELRKRTAELYAKVGRVTDALDHVGYLLQTDPDNPELKTLRMQYQTRAGNYDAAVKDGYELVGYNLQDDEFDAKKAAAPHDPRVYAGLASVLRTKKENPELADRVMDQMIKVNPDSAEAYLIRGTYLMSDEEQKQRGRADVEKAYQLDPKNADVLLTMGALAGEDKEFEKAHEYLETGKKLYPQDTRFYTSLASVEYQEKDYDGSLAQVDEGLKKVEGNNAQVLLIFKADLQFRNEDLAGVRETIEAMEAANFRPEYIDWLNARIKLSEGKWYEAAQDLKQLRARVADLFDLSIQTDMFLGLCYEKLGRWELARDSYASVLKQDEDNEPAAAGFERMRDRIGLKVADTGEEPSEAEAAGAVNLQKLINAELQKPEKEQNWTEIIAGLEKMAEEQKWEEARLKLTLADIAVKRKKFAEARKLLEEANRVSPDNLQIARMSVEVLRADPKYGPAAAMKRLDAVVKKFGDLPILRLQRAQLLLQSNLEAEDLKTQLTALTVDTDDWTDQQKVELWSGLAGIYLSLSMPEEARRYLTLAADHQPNDLPTRLTLFALALEANDDEAMRAAQDRILEIVKDKNDSTWLYTEARRQLLLVRRGQLEPKALDEIRILIDRALAQRPDWNELYLLSAELELAAGNAEQALKHYEAAAARGLGNPTANAQHIKLVSMRGDFNRAKQLLERIPEGLRQPLLGPLYAEILFRTNEVDNAIAKARAAAEANDTNPNNHYWLGELLGRSAQMPDKTEAQRKAAVQQAIAAFEKTVELRPDLADAWFALIRLHAINKDAAAAQAALREAQLVLTSDTLPLFMARSHEALGRWFDAETMYRTVYESDPEDVGRAQLLANFYLGPVYQQPDRQAKVTPLINQILRAGADGKLEPNAPTLLWARRMGAKLLAASGDYQQLLKAQNLLASNSQGGVLSIEDKLEMAQILASRPDPVSRSTAANLLEEVAGVQPLNVAGEITLGRMYYLLGRWSDSQRHMRSTIAKFANSAEARASYIGMLLEHGQKSDLDEAGRQLAKLRELAPNAVITFELTARLASKTGREREVSADLLRALSQLTQAQEFTPQHVEMLKRLANLLVDLNDLANAEKIFRLLAEKDPREQYSLAMFLGLHRNVDQAFELFEQLYRPDAATDVLQRASNVLRERRDEIGDKFDAQVQQWFDRALRENPDSIPLLMAQADFLDVQKRYEDAVAVYRKLLSRPDLVEFRRAVVLNNLSYLLALAGPSGASDIDPLKLVEEAASILGPTADILDTRAVVLISIKRYDEAIHDLELSVTDNPTASKYFHKVQAHLGARQNKAALESWDRAEQLGLKREDLNRLEHERYDEVKRQIDAIRAGSGTVTQAEPPRRAA